MVQAFKSVALVCPTSNIFTVTNSGPFDADRALVVLQLPVGVVFVSAADSQGAMPSYFLAR